ncbi:MAG TPA: hypothetical protein VLJ79_33865 [Candidatus Binatia bacterium]|nr:hypothetical protein [Candidatus Binatia bacterium]
MAKELSDDMIVDEIIRRGIEGTDHPVTYKGEICTTYKEYRDLLLMFEAKPPNAGIQGLI